MTASSSSSIVAVTGNWLIVGRYIVQIGKPLLVVLVLLSLACCRPTDMPAGQLPLHPIVVYGDCRTGHSIHRRIVKGIVGSEPEAVFNTGDLVVVGSDVDQWATFNDITSELREAAPYYPALGNHDLPPELFFAGFDLPNNERWYSVSIDGLHFVVLDTTSDISRGSEQYVWLEAQLQTASKDFVVVVTHYPLLSTGLHGDELGLGPILMPLFEQYNVDVVFSGHDHDYERSYKDGIYYVVTGGGGAPLRDQAGTNDYSQVFDKIYHLCTLSVDAESVTVRAFDPGIRLIDEFTIELS